MVEHYGKDLLDIPNNDGLTVRQIITDPENPIDFPQHLLAQQSVEESLTNEGDEVSSANDNLLIY